MSGTSEFYLACAAQSLRDADASTLTNVRDRCLRSAASWQAMAVRAAEIEANRRAREKRAPDAVADLGDPVSS
ncbi:hypothetical protein [Novosphingobium sp. Fuku2-ISO-50]|jgi:hypothetical protein|uniref:hypothetical protein n=2 Tax=Pseudomonadota TaxID=1224 RepID=UPI00076C5871|nr:hypothetical protein [Novosphingobium sp. Fuku2-ISO-50]KUR74554.1 hypothetical protein AQZ50_17275 [Novosphingobium sp. Fuku2-ISO-50]